MSYNPFSLKGKTILITGASSGIGRATAIQCSRLGASVIITGRNEERLKETLSLLDGDADKHKYVIADLTQEEGLDAVVSSVDKIEGIVLCAGKGQTLPFQFCKREKLDTVFEVNFFAPVELLRLLVKKNKLTRDGAIVFVSSIGGTLSHEPGNGVYGASKAALNSIMKTTAKELASKGLRVNSVCPGMVNTPLISGGTISEEQLLQDVERYPLKRYGEPEDIANGIVYLLSDAASWVTGHSLVIDGGRTI